MSEDSDWLRAVPGPDRPWPYTNRYRFVSKAFQDFSWRTSCLAYAHPVLAFIFVAVVVPAIDWPTTWGRGVWSAVSVAFVYTLGMLPIWLFVRKRPESERP